MTPRNITFAALSFAQLGLLNTAIAVFVLGQTVPNWLVTLTVAISAASNLALCFGKEG